MRKHFTFRPRIRTTLMLSLLAILLLLVGTVIATGWQRVSVQHVLELNAAIGRIQSALLQCRNLEQASLSQLDEDSARRHSGYYTEVVEATRELRKRVSEPDLQSGLDELQKREQTYRAAFQDLVENRRRRYSGPTPEPPSSPRRDPSIVLETRRLARGLEQRLHGFPSSEEGLRNFLQVRRYEKNFLLYGDAVLFEDPGPTTAMWDRFLDLTQIQLTGRDDALGLLEAYREKSTELRSNVQEGLKLAAEVEAAANECHHLISELRRSAIARTGVVSDLAQTIGLFSLASAAVLFLVIAWWLARAVVQPIEYLQHLVERAEGDIQDLDVEFADIDFRRFRSQESHDLALALRQMVSRMRHLVSSERGLMERHHLAIVLAADRALGAAGRGVVERARAAAGLETFTDLSTPDLETFLEQLETEIGALLPPEKKWRLSETIRQEVRNSRWP